MNYFSIPEDKSIKKSECNHNKIVKVDERQNCYYCGIYLPKNEDITAYRFKSMNYECLMDIEKNYQAMFKYDFSKDLEKINENYKIQREELVGQIIDLGTRFKFCSNTISLGILYLDIINMRETISPLQFSLYAVTCIFLSAKAIELDMKIPFISKLRQYSSLHYRPEEIKKAEIAIIKLLDWKLQLTTLTEILDFYLTQGVLFSNDEIAEKTPTRSIENQFNLFQIADEQEKKEVSLPQKQLKLLKDFEMTDLLTKIEKDAIKLNLFFNKSKLQLKFIVLIDLTFFQYDKKKLALATIIFLRKKNGIINHWNNELEVISGKITEDQAKDLAALIEQQYEKSQQLTSILTCNNFKSNWSIKEQDTNIKFKQLDTYKQYGSNFSRPSTALLQPRNENFLHQESIPISSRFINNQEFSNNFIRQPYQKKLTQEFKHPNDFSFQSRQLYRLNTAYPSIESRSQKEFMKF